MKNVTKRNTNTMEQQTRAALDTARNAQAARQAARNAAQDVYYDDAAAARDAAYDVYCAAAVAARDAARDADNARDAYYRALDYADAAAAADAVIDAARDGRTY